MRTNIIFILLNMVIAARLFWFSIFSILLWRHLNATFLVLETNYTIVASELVEARGMVKLSQHHPSDDDHILDALWNGHTDLAKKFEDLTNEFVKFVGDLRR